MFVTYWAQTSRDHTERTRERERQAQTDRQTEREKKYEMAVVT